jgi:hypothetical protein
MTVTMAMISSLQEGISLADFCLPESFFSLWVFLPVEAAEYLIDPPTSLRFSGWWYTRRGTGRRGSGPPHHVVVRPGQARASGWCGPLVAHLCLSSWLLSSSGKIWTSRYFPGIADLQKYGILIVLFLAEFWLRQLILQ